MIGSPVFLVAAERSGTTMLRLMLSTIRRSPGAATGYAVNLMPESGGWPDLAAYREFLLTNRIFRLGHGFEIDPNLSYPELVNSFLEQLQRRTGKPIVGALVHRHFDRLLRIWPDARFIHLIRDGRDVARSCIGMGWAGSVWTGTALDRDRAALGCDADAIARGSLDRGPLRATGLRPAWRTGGSAPSWASRTARRCFPTRARQPTMPPSRSLPSSGHQALGAGYPPG